MNNVLKNKIFISHSEKDKEFVKLLINLLESIGMNETNIFCSSMPGYGVPLKNNIYDYLAKEFTTNELLVVYILSNNYYKSVACLNEMGAAWVLKKDYMSLLLPGFEFEKIKGAIDPCQIGIKLDGDEEFTKHRLGELKDMCVKLFNLEAITATRWERKRDEFIASINNLRR